MFELTFPFNDSANYIFDATKIEVTGGVAKLKDLGGGVYSTDDPTIEVDYSFAADALNEFSSIENIPSNTRIRAIIKVNFVWYWWDGVAWSVSDESYNQAATVNDLNANIATLLSDTGIIRIKFFLHTTDVAATPDISSATVKFDFGVAQDSLNLCTVYGYARDKNGEISTDPITVNLNKDSVVYKDNVTIYSEAKTVTPRASDGFWEIHLIECQNMANSDSSYEPPRYEFTFGEDVKCRFVPNQPSIEFGLLGNEYIEI